MTLHGTSSLEFDVVSGSKRTLGEGANVIIQDPYEMETDKHPYPPPSRYGRVERESRRL